MLKVLELLQKEQNTWWLEKVGTNHELGSSRRALCDVTHWFPWKCCLAQTVRQVEPREAELPSFLSLNRNTRADIITTLSSFPVRTGTD